MQTFANPKLRENIYTRVILVFPELSSSHWKKKRHALLFLRKILGEELETQSRWLLNYRGTDRWEEVPSRHGSHQRSCHPNPPALVFVSLSFAHQGPSSNLLQIRVVQPGY